MTFRPCYNGARFISGPLSVSQYWAHSTPTGLLPRILHSLKCSYRHNSKIPWRVGSRGKVQHDSSAVFSGQLFANNQRVGLIAYGSGVAAGIPTAYMLFENGAILGALSAEITKVRQHHTFWPGILPHGIAELTAIFICGAGGLLLGKGLLFPGRYRRSEAFRKAGMESIYLALGSIPLFIFAGIVEGMFSHLGIPGWVRLTFALINGTLWYLYLFVPRERPEEESQQIAKRISGPNAESSAQPNGSLNG